jgi:hypothetical protein
LITAFGVKPVGKWQWLFKAFWIYGAVEPATGELFFWQFSHVDTACYQQYLNEFSTAHPDSLNILQVDNGRFHCGKNLIVPENVILLFQREHLTYAMSINTYTRNQVVARLSR